MAVKPVVLFPDPILKSPCDDVVNPLNPGSRAMLQDLRDTFYANPGVGLAAPQIALPWRIIVVDTRRHPKFGDQSHGLLQLFNPVIIESSGKRVGREGCLSIPDYIVRVPRKEKIIVQAMDENNNPVTLRATGFEAVCLQHEIDHLDGILIFDRIRSIRSDLFRRGASS
jgi:peptide deformylase